MHVLVCVFRSIDSVMHLRYVHLHVFMCAYVLMSVSMSPFLCMNMCIPVLMCCMHVSASSGMCVCVCVCDNIDMN